MQNRLALFVVGADGSGKTEISTRLSQITGIERFKCPSEKEWFKTNSFHKNLAFDALLPSFCKQTNTSFISDRGYPCEWVYSTFYKRETDYVLLKNLDKMWSVNGGAILHMTRSDYSKVEDDLVDTKDLKSIDNLYRDFLKQSLLPSMTVCTDDFVDDTSINSWIKGSTNKVLDWLIKLDTYHGMLFAH